MRQLKQMTMAVFAVFGRLFAFGALGAQGTGGNFRRALGAICLSAILGIGNAAFAAGIGHAAGERIDIASTEGWEALHYSAKADDWRRIQSLLERGADANVRTNNAKKETAVHIAVRFGSLKSLSVLIKARANIDTKNSDGYTPVRLALENGHIDAARALKSAGANIKPFINTPTGGYARTYLHFAAKNDQPKYIKALVALGSKINLQDNGGMTPLHVAALHNSPDAARALIELGADAGVKTNKGDYATWLADRYGHDSEIRKILQKPMEAHERRVAERKRKECEDREKERMENVRGCHRNTPDVFWWVCGYKHPPQIC